MTNNMNMGRDPALEARTLNGVTFTDSLHRLHWGGILAGTLTGLVTYIALGALGVAIGFGAAANLSDIRGLQGIGITGAIWLVLSLAGTDLNMARGRFNGVMTGIAMCAVLTLATLGGISSLAMNVGNAAGSAVSTAVTATAGGLAATGAAANNAGGLEGLASRIGLGDELQALQNGLNRNEISQIIADASPELNQTQVGAAAATIESIINNASRNIGGNLTDVSNIGGIVTKQADAIGAALQGDQFSSRLQRRGLSKAQADEVVTVVSKRVTELRHGTEDQVRRRRHEGQVHPIGEEPAAAAASAIWLWLAAVGVTLVAATFGGGYGATDKSMVKAVVHNS